jgi:hypothetical protein
MSFAYTGKRWSDQLSDSESDVDTQVDTQVEREKDIPQRPPQRLPRRFPQNIPRKPTQRPPGRKIYKMCISSIKNIPCKNAENCTYAHSLQELNCREHCHSGIDCDYIISSETESVYKNYYDGNNPKYLCTRWHPNETTRSWLERMYVQTGLVKSISEALFGNSNVSSRQITTLQVTTPKVSTPKVTTPKVTTSQVTTSQVTTQVKQPKQSTLSFFIRKTSPCKCITLGVECEYKNKNKYCFFVHSLNEFRKPWDCPDGTECKKHRVCGYAHFDEDIQVSLCPKGNKCPDIIRDAKDQTLYHNAHEVPCYKWHYCIESKASFDSRVSGCTQFDKNIKVSLCPKGNKCPNIVIDAKDQTRYHNTNQVPCCKLHYVVESQASFDSRVSILFV